MPDPVHIVLLNGPGSVGKGSVARALQAITEKPFLHVEMDAFLRMLPPRYLDHPDGLWFETVATEPAPSVHARTGPVAEQVLRSMRVAVAALADAGQNLIVDEVIFGADEDDPEAPLADYRRRLASHHLHVVGLTAPLDVLEARERGRGDRHIGLARWQHDRVHRGIVYDLFVDTGSQEADACARGIKECFGL